MCQLIYHIFNDIAIYFVLVLNGVNPFPTKQEKTIPGKFVIFCLISCKVLIKCTENYSRCLLHASGLWTNRVLHSRQITVVGRNMDSLIFIAKFETLQGKLLNISRCFIWASHKDFFSDNSCASPSTFCVSFVPKLWLNQCLAQLHSTWGLSGPFSFQAQTFRRSCWICG